MVSYVFGLQTGAFIPCKPKAKTADTCTSKAYMVKARNLTALPNCSIYRVAAMPMKRIFNIPPATTGPKKPALGLYQQVMARVPVWRSVWIGS